MWQLNSWALLKSVYDVNDACRPFEAPMENDMANGSNAATEKFKNCLAQYLTGIM